MAASSPSSPPNNRDTVAYLVDDYASSPASSISSPTSEHFVDVPLPLPTEFELIPPRPSSTILYSPPPGSDNTWDPAGTPSPSNINFSAPTPRSVVSVGTESSRQPVASGSGGEGTSSALPARGTHLRQRSSVSQGILFVAKEGKNPFEEYGYSPQTPVFVLEDDPFENHYPPTTRTATGSERWRREEAEAFDVDWRYDLSQSTPAALYALSVIMPLADDDRLHEFEVGEGPGKRWRREGRERLIIEERGFGGDGMSWLGVLNMSFLIILGFGILFLFIYYPIYDQYVPASSGSIGDS
ncbi:hypothetical protein MNV49_000713 [Pseudohyphozyma bogoriensis]|nr:hypothetical protein MNV49_000713 [Pseudohyphozyma bogoriensis]